MRATISLSDDPAARPAFWPRKYFNIFRVSLVECLAYRLDFILTMFLRLLPVASTILLWQAVYAGDGRPFKGYTLGNMVAYLLLVQISRTFSAMPGLAHGIARDIRDGNLKKYLLQPIEMLPYLLSYRVAHKVADLATSALPYAVLFGLCHQYFRLPASAWTWPAYLLSLLMGFVIGFYFEAALGMVAFWFLEITSFLYVVSTVTFFLSGQMFPLDLLPGPWARAFELLPFNYLGYFPATVFLEKVSGREMVVALLIQAAWALGFFVAAHLLYRIGLRRFSASGG